MPFARVPRARRCSSRWGWRATELRGSPAHGVLAHGRRRRSRSSAELQRPTLLARRPRRPTATSGAVPRARRYRARASAGSIRARGAWASRSAATRSRTGRDARTAGDVRSLRRRRHDAVGRSRTPACALVALTDRPFDDWADDALRLLAGADRRRAWPRSPGMTFGPGDRVRWATTGDDGLPLVRYGFVGGVAGEPGPVVVMLDGELSGDVVDLEPAAAGDDHERRAAPRRRRPDRRSRPAPRPRAPVAGRGRHGRARRRLGARASAPASSCPTSSWSLAALTSGGEQYVVRALRTDVDPEVVLHPRRASCRSDRVRSGLVRRSGRPSNRAGNAGPEHVSSLAHDTGGMQPHATVPLSEIDLSDPEFWLADRAYRDAAFQHPARHARAAVLRRVGVPGLPVPAGPRLLRADALRGRVGGEPQPAAVLLRAGLEHRRHARRRSPSSSAR